MKMKMNPARQPARHRETRPRSIVWMTAHRMPNAWPISIQPAGAATARRDYSTNTQHAIIGQSNLTLRLRDLEGRG